MGRITYVTEASSSTTTTAQPLNLAFATPAAARASWASKDRDENLWDFDDGALPPYSAAHNGGSAFPSSIRETDIDEAPPPAAPAPPPFATTAQRTTHLSIAEFIAAGPSPGAASLLMSPSSPGIHTIPRNSVLFRTHATQQNMTSSLPPAEPNAPSAMQVASVMEERRSRGMTPHSEHIRAAFRAHSRANSGLRSVPLRSASFSNGVPPAGSTLRRGADSNRSSSSGSGVSCNGLITLRKVSHTDVYTLDGGAPLGAITATDSVSANTDKAIAAAMAGAVGGGGGGERDGCLVLPILRTLLAMQDESPRQSAAKLSSHIMSHPTQNWHGQSLHGMPGPGAHGPALQSRVSIGGGLPKQTSQQALRVSASSALGGGYSTSFSGGGGGGGGGTRQATQMASSASTARRRGMSIAAAGGIADSSVHGKQTPVRRQMSTFRPSFPAGGSSVASGVGSATSLPPPLPPLDDDELELEPVRRTASYTMSMSPTSPLQSFTQQQSGLRGTRQPSNLGMTSPVETADGGLGGGDTSFAQPATRTSIAAAGAVAASRMVSIKQQQLQQPPPLSSPTAQTATVKASKSGKALFAWTSKFGKGKWPWTSSASTRGANGSGGGSATGTSTTSYSGGGGPDFVAPYSLGSPVPGVDASAAATAATVSGHALSSAFQSSPVGHYHSSPVGLVFRSSVSGNGQHSYSSISSGQQQLQHELAAVGGTGGFRSGYGGNSSYSGVSGGGAGHRDLTQLPPIETQQWRKLPSSGNSGIYPSEPLSPTGHRAGGFMVASGGGSASKR